ncbi:MAG: hypothetical protein OEZ58_04665 [Gammaproteobacteria bacterium]|nr:hypothetical protein [Gammaproteobacteria bacterium]
MNIVIVPFAGVNPTYIDNLADDLLVFDCQIECVDFQNVPKQAYNTKRKQFLADTILHFVKQFPGGKVIGVMNQDIYRYVLEFVRGVADLPGRAALISIIRLLEDGNHDLMRERINKLAIHELAHTRGYEHCSDPSCVMYACDNLQQFDNMKKAICPRCLEKYAKSAYVNMNF